jgi:hypothetical protein
MPATNNTSDSPSKKKIKKPPMPLPPPDPPLVQQHPVAVCTCHHPQHQQRADINPYENYDVPKSLLGPSYPRVSLLLWTYLAYFDLNFSYRIDLFTCIHYKWCRI